MTIGVTVTREGIVVVGLLPLLPTTVRGIMEYCWFGLVSVSTVGLCDGDNAKYVWMVCVLYIYNLIYIFIFRLISIYMYIYIYIYIGIGSFCSSLVVVFRLG